MTAKKSDEKTGKSELDNSKMWSEKGVPAGRAGEDEEMAQAVLFLGRRARYASS